MSERATHRSGTRSSSVLLAVAVILVHAGCAKKEPQIPAPHAPPAPPSGPIPAATKASVPAVASKTFARDLSGQLDRIDVVLADSGFNGVRLDTTEFWKTKEAEIPKLREIARVSDPAIDPRHYLDIAVRADRWAADDGTVTYEMLLKNADRYAGRPWFLVNALIIDIKEAESVTMARIFMDPGRNPLLVGGRFVTNFTKGDHVDVVGYFAGNYEYEAVGGNKVTLPAFAAAGLFKTGTLRAMNRVSKVWQGDLPETQLRSKQRKL